MTTKNFTINTNNTIGSMKNEFKTIFLNFFKDAAKLSGESMSESDKVVIIMFSDLLMQNNINLDQNGITESYVTEMHKAFPTKNIGSCNIIVDKNTNSIILNFSFTVYSHLEHKYIINFKKLKNNLKTEEVFDFKITRGEAEILLGISSENEITKTEIKLNLLKKLDKLLKK